MATIQEKAKSLGKLIIRRMIDVFSSKNPNEKFKRPDLIKSKILLLQIKYGGLGDHLFYSHIPRIAKECGYKKVYISNQSDYRNPIYKKIVWECNPYVDGFIDGIGEYPEFAEVPEGMNLLDRIMIELDLDDKKRFHDPELYYKPEIRPELKDKTIYDPNYVSNAGDIIKAKKIEKYLQDHNIKIDYQMKLRDKSIPIKATKNILAAKDLEDFVSIVASCKRMYCLASGTATLSSALKKNSIVFYSTNLKPMFLHSKMHNYVKI